MSSTATLEALRVAQAELCSGNMNGAVYIQLSPGAAMFQTDRVVTLEKLSKEICQAIQRDGMKSAQNPANSARQETSKSALEE
jgi:hypothetical protein